MKTIGWLLLGALALVSMMPAAELAAAPGVTYVNTANGGARKVTKSRKNYTAKPYKFKKWKAPKAGKVKKWTTR